MTPAVWLALLGFLTGVVALAKAWLERRAASEQSEAVAADLAANERAAEAKAAIHEKAAEDRHRETGDRVDQLSDDLGYTGPRLGGPSGGGRT